MGVFHQLDDLRQSRVGADFLCPEPNGAVCIERGSIYRVADFFIHRHAFTGQHGFVNCGMPFQYSAVHGDFPAGFHDDDVTDLYFIDGDFFLHSAVKDDGCFRCKSHQLFDRLAGSSFGDGLKCFTQHDQRDDNACCLEV